MLEWEFLDIPVVLEHAEHVALLVRIADGSDLNRLRLMEKVHKHLFALFRRFHDESSKKFYFDYRYATINCK